MQKLRFILALAAAFLPVFAAQASTTSIPASDSRITYVGRTLKAEGEVSFDWSATSARISFTGTGLDLSASSTGLNYFNVWIDRDPSAEPDKVLKLDKDTRLLQIVAPEDLNRIYPGNKKSRTGIHRVTIQKRTEGSQGKVTFSEFTCTGEFLQAEPLKERLIEFVGDSYTCGYGSENSVSSDHFKPETENTSKTYAAILARYFDADYITISHSGQGIDRNYGDGGRGNNMTLRYGKLFDEGKEAWTASESDIHPAVTVIYLGTNDFSTNRQPTRDAFVRNYIKLLRQIKENYGDGHPVICVSSPQDPILFEYVRNAVEVCALENIHYLGFFSGIYHNDDSEMGADFHPNYQAHIKLAHAILPYVSTATGWELTGNKIQ